MPYLNIQTNQSLNPEAQDKLLSEGSKLVASALGKSEDYMMVSLQDGAPMLFGGKPDPTALLELNSLGIPEGATKEICKQLCALVDSVAEIPPERVYVKFNDIQRSMWGWKGDMFG